MFNNQEFRSKLTKQMGVLIMKKIFSRIIMNIFAGRNVMLVDAPLLYESKVLEHICFPVVVVGCEEKTEISRLMKRDGYSEE